MPTPPHHFKFKAAQQPSLRGSYGASIGALVFLALLQAPLARAVPINFAGGQFGDPAVIHYLSDAVTPIPTDGSFKFELGVFASPFVPTVANHDQWLANWRPVTDAVGAPDPAATTDFTIIPFLFGDFDGFNSTVDLLHNNPPHGVGVQTYIWGFDNRSVAGAGQWILLTDSAEWKIPDALSGLSNSPTWTVGNSNPAQILLGSRTGASMTMGSVNVGGAVGPLITIDDQNTNEDSGSVSFTIELSESAQTATTVNYSVVAETAEPGDDFTVDSGTLTIDAGATTAPLAVSVAEDNIDETNETFRVVLTNPQGATLMDPEGIGTIVDNDPPPQVSISAATAYENGGTLQIPISLSAPSEFPISVNLVQSAGNIVVGVDIVTLPTIANFAPGETSITVGVSLIDDSTPEVDKWNFITLDSPVNAVLGSAGVKSAITILDDDALAQLEGTGSLSFNAATGVMTISWDAVANRPYHIMFTTDLINWAPLPEAGMLNPTSSNASFTHPDAAEIRGFYKIVNGHAP